MTAMVRALIGPEPISTASYLAWIAYPGEEDGAARSRFVRACAAGVHKATVGGWAPPGLRGWDRRPIINTINQSLDRIHKRRLRAVWMALHQLHVSEDDALNGWGLNEAARMALDSAGAVDQRQGPVIPETETGYQNDDAFNPGNVKRLIWYESLPALAMTLALPLSLARPGERRSVLELISAPGWVDESITAAQQLAPVIEESFSPKRLLIPSR